MVYSNDEFTLMLTLLCLQIYAGNQVRTISISERVFESWSMLIKDANKIL